MSGKQLNWEPILVECGVKRNTAALWAAAFNRMVCPENFSAGFSEIDDFVGQILHESGMLESVAENLNYSSASRIRAVWPSRFPTDDSAAPYVRNPQSLANKVYGGRMGNTGPDDGWRYRGRGLLMVTGRENYRTVGEAIGLDLERDPDQLASPSVALLASIAWWERNLPDSAMGDITRVTKRVNGGTVGLDHRTKITRAVAGALKAFA